jgi:hypothetical protein
LRDAQNYDEWLCGLCPLHGQPSVFFFNVPCRPCIYQTDISDSSTVYPRTSRWYYFFSLCPTRSVASLLHFPTINSKQGLEPTNSIHKPESEGKPIIRISRSSMLQSSSYLTDIQLMSKSVTSLALSPAGHTPVIMGSELTGAARSSLWS